MSVLPDLEIVDDQQGLVYRRVVVGPLQANCWIIFAADTHRAIVVDPGDQPGRLIDAGSDLSIAAVVLTHSHWDHVLGLATVTDLWGCNVCTLIPTTRWCGPHELADSA